MIVSTKLHGKLFYLLSMMNEYYIPSEQVIPFLYRFCLILNDTMCKNTL